MIDCDAVVQKYRGIVERASRGNPRFNSSKITWAGQVAEMLNKCSNQKYMEGLLVSSRTLYLALRRMVVRSGLASENTGAICQAQSDIISDEIVAVLEAVQREATNEEFVKSMQHDYGFGRIIPTMAILDDLASHPKTLECPKCAELDSEHAPEWKGESIMHCVLIVSKLVVEDGVSKVCNFSYWLNEDGVFEYKRMAGRQT